MKNQVQYLCIKGIKNIIKAFSLTMTSQMEMESSGQLFLWPNYYGLLN